MEFKSKDDLLEYFIKKIKSSSRLEINQIMEDTQAIKQKRIDEIEEGAHLTADLMKAQEKKLMMNAHALTMSRYTEEFNQAKIKLREARIASLFGKIEAKLLEYSESETYQNKMKDKLKALALKYDDMKTLRVKAVDQPWLSDFMAGINDQVKVEVDQEIHLGGFLLEFSNSMIVIDESLDNRLVEETQRFYENPDLVLF